MFLSYKIIWILSHSNIIYFIFNPSHKNTFRKFAYCIYHRHWNGWKSKVDNLSQIPLFVGYVGTHIPSQHSHNMSAKVLPSSRSELDVYLKGNELRTKFHDLFDAFSVSQADIKYFIDILLFHTYFQIFKDLKVQFLFETN